MTFDQWFEGYAPTAPEVLDECARAAWYAAVSAEREACAQLCRRPDGWLNPSQQKIADEIQSAILARSTD